MTSKHFCLKWTRFQTSILSAFESLQNSEDLADVTLTCDGISLKAHKFILSACSPYFRTIFKIHKEEGVRTEVIEHIHQQYKKCNLEQVELENIISRREIITKHALSEIRFSVGEINPHINVYVAITRWHESNSMEVGVLTHRIVLKISSENPCPHPIVILKDVSYVDLIAIIDFMYHGEVMVSEEQLSSFLHTAMVLQVLGLMNNSETVPKKTVIPHKKAKVSNESPECPTKKVKLNPKPKKSQPAPYCGDIQKEVEQGSLSQFEVVEVDRIKTENEMETTSNEFCGDVNENVEVIVGDKSESQGSILEAALEVRDKPSSILERSLTAQAVSGKSPSSLPILPDKMCILPDLSKTIFIPRKPPEVEIEKRVIRSSSESSSPSTFDRPSEILQQNIKIEGEHCESVDSFSPDDLKEINFSSRNIDIQPHHSSQCGNCPHCGKVYSNQSALKYHVRLVHSDLTNMYCCHLCPESFDYREGYKKHMAEVHMIRN